ncbi:hypothetical protein ONZ51_g8079 [Trametes cubensis]|uniref:Restriction of telomere capping protein 4 n=1 Tax=Trametes cubensis TaxID=1111947 RepID=A0AAD7X9K4_9APHY|nr:hypothetical protein ONZ51_g8079 [Trametes cubensis]
METITRDMNAKGVNLYSDSSSATRLSQRPSQAQGMPFEDFGSDFSSRSRSTSRTSQPPRGKRASSKQASSSKKTIIDLSGDFSDDELDFLSSSSRHGSESPAKPKERRRVEEMRLPADPVPIAIDRHQTASNYRPLDLKKMKISKKSSATSSATATPKNTQGNHLSGTSGSSSSALSSAKPLASSSARESGNQAGRPKSEGKRPSPRADEDSEVVEKTPRPSRPAPRPVYKGAAGKVVKSQTVADMQPSSSQSQEKTTKEKAQPVARSQSLVDVLNSLQEQDANSPRVSTLNSKPNGKVITKSKTERDTKVAPSRKEKGKQRVEVDPISALFADRSPPPSSSDRASAKKHLSDFPMPSPLSSPITHRASSPPRTSQSRSHRVVLSEEEESETGGRSLRPFPMETQMLESLHRVSPAKRSNVGSDVEQDDKTYRKRPRRSSPDKYAFFAFNGDDSGSDLDDIFLDPSIDPATLCPWCDEPLPPKPTPHLRSLIEGARRRSYPDDRPTNPLGLRAPPTVFVGVCQRHRFERVWIPRARRKGWPTDIDWGRLKGRVENLRGQLKAIVEDIDEDFVPGSKDAISAKGKERARYRPRKENEFWQEVVQNVKQQGSRQTTGVRGQFLHFNKSQPGYYGELGYVIIHQTLCDLFPPASFDPAAALPLTPADFIAHVLVPEAALNLIMEDLHLSRSDALKTLRDSVEYGVAMFPVDEGEGGKGVGDESVLTAGEKIIMERAKARRKELEEEERREEEEARSARERERQTDTEPDMDVDVDSPPPSSQSKKPKPRPVTKRQPPSSEKSNPPPMTRARSRSRTIEVSSDTGDASETSRSGATKPHRKPRGEVASERSDAPSDTGVPADGKTPRPKPKPRPRGIGRSATTSSSQLDLHPPSDSQDGGNSPPSSLSALTVSGQRGPDRETSLPVDTTPRPRPRPVHKARRPDSPEPTASKRSEATQAGLPLQMAKQRRQERANSASKSSHADGWLPNLRAADIDDLSSTDDDEVPPPPAQPSQSSKRVQPRRTASRSGKNGDENKWGWLLSDESSSSRTPSFNTMD